jgi:hypothetical protein
VSANNTEIKQTFLAWFTKNYHLVETEMSKKKPDVFQRITDLHKLFKQSQEFTDFPLVKRHFTRYVTIDAIRKDPVFSQYYRYNYDETVNGKRTRSTYVVVATAKT